MRYLLLLVIQIAICNNVLFLGFINPQVYLLFVLLFPINSEQWKVILMSFIIGLSIDFFNNTGGANAAACITVAFIRPMLISSCFGLNYHEQNLKLTRLSNKHGLYFFLGALIHSIILFALEVFDIELLSYIVLQTLSTTLATTLTMLVSVLLFFDKYSKKRG